MIICATGSRICSDYYRGQCRRAGPCRYKAERNRRKKEAARD
jgi:hypothetical protein